MTIAAKVIEDSVSEHGVRITTLQLFYPRFIHSEFMTHRVFSRNASSSRAIPVAKMIETVRTNPAMPIHWGANQPGMQAKAELSGDELNGVQNAWMQAARCAANIAEDMERVGLHKQVANRILEPFQHIQVVVTATEWKNFFELRDHPDAQPEIRDLAIQMKSAMDVSEPKALVEDQWHLPYVLEEERADSYWTKSGNKFGLCKVSAARCARVSYLLHDGAIPDISKDMALYERLVGSTPIHASPIEHQATPGFRESDGSWFNKRTHGNFVGWVQFRKLFEMDVL